MAPKVVTLSVPEFAQLVGKTRQCIYQWIQKGMPHRRERGVTKIVPAEGVKWIIEYETWELQQQRKGRRDDIPDEDDEKALAARATRLLKEHELFEKTRQVVPATEHIEFVETMMGTFAGVAAGRLQAFERDIVRASSLADARKITQRMHSELMAGARSYADRLDDEAAEIEKEARLKLAPASIGDIAGATRDDAEGGGGDDADD